MDKIIPALMAMIMMPWAMYVSAHEQQGTSTVSGIVNLNDSANVYRALYDNTPIEPEFMLVPKFAIVGAENKFVFSVGAQMKFTSSFDWGNPVRNPQGMGPADIKPPLTSDRNLYQMTAGGSGIFFNIIGFPNTANEVGLFMSLALDTYSDNSYKLGAGQIYMRYHDLQCGYANSLYNDRKADAFTIDGHGPCASGAYTTVVANWQHHFKSHIRVGIGIEIPKASYTQIDVTGMPDQTSTVVYELTSHQYMPNFPMYLEYVWGKGHVRMSSILRNVHYIDLLSGKSHGVFGYGLKFTGNAEVGPVNLLWMCQYAHASANCLHDDSDAGLDLVPDDATPGILRATRGWGQLAAVQWNISPKVFTTLQCSYLRNYIPRYDIQATVPYSRQLRYGYTYMANVVWKLSPLFSMGMEYRHAHRTNEGGANLANNRVYAMLMMNF